MRIGVAGFLHESNSFLSVPTERDAFDAPGVTVGGEVMDRWADAHHEVGGFIAGAKQFEFDAVGIQMAQAVPSGAITGEAFESIIGQMLGQFKRAGRLDGVLLALHGATVCETFLDADGEVAARVRHCVGPDVPIVLTLDCHANVSTRMIANVDATVMYRTNPHLDQRDRGTEAAGLIARIVRGEIRPVQALATPPMIIPIANQHTAASPAKELIDDVEKLIRQPDILSASVALGFPYADVAEMGTSFLVVDPFPSQGGGRISPLVPLRRERRSKKRGTSPTTSTENPFSSRAPTVWTGSLREEWTRRIVPSSRR